MNSVCQTFLNKGFINLNNLSLFYQTLRDEMKWQFESEAKLKTIFMDQHEDLLNEIESCNIEIADLLKQIKILEDRKIKAQIQLESFDKILRKLNEEDEQQANDNNKEYVMFYL